MLRHHHHQRQDVGHHRPPEYQLPHGYDDESGENEDTVDMSLDYPQCDPVFSDYPSSVPQGIPLVIDHGSKNCRMGWAHEKDPRLCFPPIWSKSRSKKDTKSDYVGNDVQATYREKNAGKSSMEGGIVVQWDVEKHVLDHGFSCLGINTESIEHPVVMTEAVCNPPVSRAYTTELMFEGYGVPSLAYGIDSLFSLYFNRPKEAVSGTNLIISCGHHASYAIPVINGRVDGKNTKRVNVGGEHIFQYAKQLLNVKWPNLIDDLTTPIIEGMLHKYCSISNAYCDQLRQLENSSYFHEMALKIQLRVDMALVPSKEQLLVRQGRKKILAARMKQMQLTQTKKRIREYEQNLSSLRKIQQTIEDLDDEDAREVLLENKIASPKTLLKLMVELERKIKRAQRFIQRGEGVEVIEEDDDEEEEEEEETIDEEKYYMLSREYSTLDEDERAMYKKQKFLKSMAEARIRHKQENEQLRKEKMEAKRLLEEEVARDLPAWLDKMAAERSVIWNELSRCKRRKEELSDRRSGASKARMRLLVQQTGGDTTTAPKEFDDFGVNDADWDVYTMISKDDSQNNVEVLEARLSEIDSLVRKYNPSMNKKQEETPESILQNLKHSKRMLLSVERIQIPELLFQPTMAGIDEGGITDMFDMVFPQYDAATQERLAENVFITGGSSLFNGFKDRVYADLRRVRPYDQTIHIYSASDALSDAWRGGASFASNSELLKKHSISKAMYEEEGAYYLQEHFASNGQLKWETSNCPSE
eukprot:m.71217 g.71217  ORF g.71217 m.71217 type:complete len:757 (+) comp8338_c7_seq2:105-2375(+)